MTRVEVDYYCKVLELQSVKEAEEKGDEKNSVQGLSQLFMNNLTAIGQKSNSTAIVKMADKIKPKE